MKKRRRDREEIEDKVRIAIEWQREIYGALDAAALLNLIVPISRIADKITREELASTLKFRLQVALHGREPGATVDACTASDTAPAPS